MDGSPKEHASNDIVEDNEEAQKLFQQFRNVFGTEIGTNLYYALNSDDDSDEVAHIRIDQMMAEMNGQTESSDSTTSKTTTTMVSPDSTDIEPPIFEDIIITSPTSSSSLYAIRTPSPQLRSFFQYPSSRQQHSQYHQRFSETDSEDEGITLTEIVEIHRVPSVALITLDNNNLSPPSLYGEVDFDMESQVNNNNNNTSCSLSSTLTDSKTLDVRTPIVV